MDGSYLCLLVLFNMLEYAFSYYAFTPGRQLIIDTTTKLAAAVEATLGWGTVQNNQGDQ